MSGATETTLITPRRNFLIRALGFGVAASAAALPAVIAAKPTLVITPELAAKMACWRDAYHAREAAREASKQAEPCDYDMRNRFQNLDTAYWEAHREVARSFFWS